MKKKIIILTGSETRHQYFRIKLSADSRFIVVATICEGDELSLKNRILNQNISDLYEINHVLAREQSETDFFEESILNNIDKSNPIFIKKGEINDDKIVRKIMSFKPDLIICYGSSLIKSDLLSFFNGKFLNVHLGLSPYYRGSGTNIWPIINKELDLIGATFMFIDSGIDTGEIIHQIRAEIFLGDSPHTIGNRLIKKMTKTFADIIANFEALTQENQLNISGKLYKNKDFNLSACRALYKNLNDEIISEYLNKHLPLNPIITNKGLTYK